MDAVHDHIADEVTPRADHLGIRWAIVWLVVGSALVGTAIVAFGWKRTLQVWAISGLALGVVIAADWFWYKHIRKSA
jgi:hypothetical protein